MTLDVHLILPVYCNQNIKKLKPYADKGVWDYAKKNLMIPPGVF